MNTLEQLLEARHPPPEWAVFTELAASTGYAQRRVDVAAFNLWQSNKFYRIAYEIKKSRSDFLRELKQPDKRSYAEDNFHETYFVCEPGVAKAEEIPDGWGYITRTTNGNKIRRVKVARARTPGDVKQNFILALLRRTCEKYATRVSATYMVDGESLTAAELNQRVRACMHEVEEALHKKGQEIHDLRKSVENDRNKLMEPWKALAKLGECRHWWGLRASDVTITEVQKWFKQAEQQVLRDIEGNIKKLHEETGLALVQLRECREERMGN